MAQIPRIWGPNCIHLLQGNCNKAVPSWGSQLQPPLVPLDGNQCVLLAEMNLFFWDYRSGGDIYQVWMHRLYIRLQRGYASPARQQAALLFWRPSVKTLRSKLFLTNSVLQGDDVAGSRGFWSENAPSLIKGLCLA
jgi:hypothetical protein